MFKGQETVTIDNECQQSAALALNATRESAQCDNSRVYLAVKASFLFLVFQYVFLSSAGFQYPDPVVEVGRVQVVAIKSNDK